MATALPILNQATKPAGVAGQARDDLALFTGANPIQLSDGGVGGSTWAWSLISQPPGGTASITTPGLATATLTGATLEGSYLIQLMVNGGGGVGEIYQIAAGVQIELPSWAATSGLRIPAFGETLQFNRKSSPASGANAQGWADEMNDWFRALASYGFGFAAQNAGVPVGSGPFYTLNLSGAGVSSMTDAGGGVLDVALAAASGTVGVANGGGGSLGPFSILDAYPSAFMPLGTAFSFDVDAQWVNAGAGRARLYTHNAVHQRKHHGPGILIHPGTNQNARTSLAPTIVSGPNPMTWSVAAIASNDRAVTNGRVLTNALIPGALTYSKVAAVLPALYDLQLLTDGTLETGLAVVAALAWTNSAIVVDISETHPTGTFALEINGSWASWDGGAESDWTLSSSHYVRLYHRNGVDWVEVWVSDVAAASTSNNWTVNGITPEYLRIARAPYWLNPVGGISTWGSGSVVPQAFRDMRNYTFQQIASNQVESTEPIDQSGKDRRLDGCVVFTHRQSNIAASYDADYNAFAILPFGGGLATQGRNIQGGEFWSRGKRYVMPTLTDIAAVPVVSSAVLVCAVVADNETVSVVAEECPLASLPAAMLSLMRDSISSPMDAHKALGAQSKVPLWWAPTDAFGVLQIDGRIDLRRDASKVWTWTAGNRADVERIVSVNSTEPMYPEAASTVLGDAAAEYESIAAALLWQYALTGSDNTSPFGGTINNTPLTIHVIRNTLERNTDVINLWNNIEIRGYGSPNVYLYKRTDDRGFVSVGAPNSENTGLGNQLVFNVAIRSLNFVVVDMFLAVVDRAVLTVYAPSWDPAESNFTGRLPSGSVQNVVFDELRFGSMSTFGLDDSTRFAAMNFLGDLSGGGLEGGTFAEISITRCSTYSLGGTPAGKPTVIFNYGIYFEGGDIAVTDIIPDKVLIQGNYLYVRTAGIDMASFASERGLRVIGNDISLMETANAALSTAIRLQDNGQPYQDACICGNRIQSEVATTPSGLALIEGSGVSNVLIQGNLLAAFTANLVDPANAATAILLRTSCNRVTIDNNQIVYYRTGVQLGSESGFASLYDVLITNNVHIGSSTGVDNDSVGIYSPLSCTATFRRLTVRNNKMNLVRAGIYLGTLTTGSHTISLCGNEIIGTNDESNVNAGTVVRGRGIFVLVEAFASQPLNLLIQGNTVKGFLGRAAIDTAYPQAGICVALSTAGGAVYGRGLDISGNFVSVSGADATPFAYTPEFWGVALYGAWLDAGVRNNTIVNMAACTLVANGGILCDARTYDNHPLCTNLQIAGNAIRWLSATDVRTNFNESGGIVVRGQQSGVCISGNEIMGQSTVAPGATTGGLFHGILLDRNTALEAHRWQVNNNVISTGVIASGLTLFGANGCPIWIRYKTTTAPTDLDYGGQINGNAITGSWEHNNDGAQAALEPLGWSSIALAIEAGAYVKAVQINGNKIVIGPYTGGNDLGGPALGCGILVGNSNFNPADVVGSGYIQINSNFIYQVLNSDFADYSAAISMVNMDTNADAIGGLQGGFEVCSNYIFRVDTNAGASVSAGIGNVGNSDIQVIGNYVNPDGVAVDLSDLALANMAANQNIWSNNRFGNGVTTGTSTLGAAVYRPQGSLNNWSGAAFV